MHRGGPLTRSVVTEEVDSRNADARTGAAAATEEVAEKEAALPDTEAALLDTEAGTAAT